MWRIQQFMQYTIVNNRNEIKNLHNIINCRICQWSLDIYRTPRPPKFIIFMLVCFSFQNRIYEIGPTLNA